MAMPGAPAMTAKSRGPPPRSRPDATPNENAAPIVSEPSDSSSSRLSAPSSARRPPPAG